MPEYASMSLSMPEHGWIMLNVPKNARKKCSDYTSVLNMSHHLIIWQGFEYARVPDKLLYNFQNIIEANIIILEFLSAWFVRPGTWQLTILSFWTRVRQGCHSQEFLLVPLLAMDSKSTSLSTGFSIAVPGCMIQLIFCCALSSWS